ncbi:MAG TPA: DUF2905 family protein [Burkholderiales bacterium]|nr:DUF2905 family protein [Burkholderiales bacterium]
MNDVEKFIVNLGSPGVERRGFVFYLPITSGLIISAALTLLLWIFRR